jgi:carbon monoxide dehydrogenase subunit G
MEMSGEQLLPVSQEKTWEALNDLEVLKACIPGCESIVPSGENQFDVALTAKVGPVSAKFKGKLTLADLDPPNSYNLAFEGQGGVAGFAKGGATVGLADKDGGTLLSYNVEAQIGGKLAQIGSRLIDGAAKKLAEQFFSAFGKHLRESDKAT